MTYSQRREIRNYLIREKQAGGAFNACDKSRRLRQGLSCKCPSCTADLAAWKGFAQAMGVALAISAIVVYVAFKFA